MNDQMNWWSQAKRLRLSEFPDGNVGPRARSGSDTFSSPSSNSKDVKKKPKGHKSRPTIASESRKSWKLNENDSTTINYGPRRFNGGVVNSRPETGHAVL